MHFHARVHSIGRISSFAVAIAAIAACSSSSSGGGISLSSVEGILEPNAGSCSSPGGPVVGPDDNHCINPDGTPILQQITPAACTDGDAGAPSGSSSGGGGGDGGGTTGDGGSDGGGMTMDAGGDSGMPDLGNCNMSAYGATNDNDHAADDDCKYNVEWSSTPICENQPVYFTGVVTHRLDGTPVTGATPVPDVVLACNHPIPNGPNGPTARRPSPEITPGVYVVGPITFDRPGKWVFRFHFFEDCLDLPQSPHGHAAFYVNVP
jgi:hypothetical protein